MSSTVGYTGGECAAPSYKSVCAGDGHTEAIKLEFDPAVISYEDLMKTVVEQASIGGGSRKQYMSAVWAVDAEQAECARRVAFQANKSALPVLSATSWHDAEDYHQKYIEKSAHARRC